MAYNLLKGKRGIITGALDENSIAWKVAQKCHEEGATFTLTNAPDRKSTRLNSSHPRLSRMPSSA